MWNELIAELLKTLQIFNPGPHSTDKVVLRKGKGLAQNHAAGSNSVCSIK